MADTVSCPALDHFLNADNCFENIGGTSAVAYYFIKDDLSAPLELTGNVYSTPAFKTGKGLYRIDLKDETQQIKGDGQGNNKGYNLTYNAVIDAVNKRVSLLSRALQNLDIGIIVPDGQTGDTQIMYDPYKRVKVEQGGISSDTGAASGDDRQTSLEFHLNGVLYDNLYVTPPQTGGWDGLMVASS